MTPRGPLAFLILAFVVAGCALVREQQPDPAAIPDGPVEALGGEPLGAVAELESGRAFGIGWRYSIYLSPDGWCTQLEMATMASGGCGTLPPQAGSAFGGVGLGGPSDGPTPIEGIVSAEVAEVWIETSTGERFETTLMSLAEAGLDDKAFVGFSPENVPIISVTALNADGDVLETWDAPDTGR